MRFGGGEVLHSRGRIGGVGFRCVISLVLICAVCLGTVPNWCRINVVRGRVQVGEELMSTNPPNIYRVLFALCGTD